MRTFFRFLWRNRLYSAINLVGFTVSLAFSIIISWLSFVSTGMVFWYAIVSFGAPAQAESNHNPAMKGSICLMFLIVMLIFMIKFLQR